MGAMMVLREWAVATHPIMNYLNSNFYRGLSREGEAQGWENFIIIIRKRR